MDRVAIISQKGGTGKTTLACSLSVAAWMDGLESVIFDAEPLVPAMVWATERKDRPPDVIPIYRKELFGGFMSTQAPGTRLAIIDTAPNLDDDAALAAHVTVPLDPSRPGCGSTLKKTYQATFRQNTDRRACNDKAVKSIRWPSLPHGRRFNYILGHRMKDIDAMIAVLEEAARARDGRIIVTFDGGGTHHQVELLADCGLVAWVSNNVARITNTGYDFLHGLERKEGFRERLQRYVDRGTPIVNAIAKVMGWLSDG